METVNIRDLRTKHLREYALKGKPLAITSRGALIGLVIPSVRSLAEQIVDYNWSRIHQSIAEGELLISAGIPAVSLDDVISAGDVASFEEEGTRNTPENLSMLVASIVGGTAGITPARKESLEWLQAILNPSPSIAGQRSRSDKPSLLTVHLSDLSASRLKEAGAAGQTFAIVHDRELIGIIIPVTRGLVEFLIEQNMSRVLYNTALGEKQTTVTDNMTTLDEVLGADE